MFTADIPLAQLEQHPEYVPRVCDDWEDPCLLHSIDRYGILYPLIVSSVKENGYRIVDGHRRFQCAKALGLASVCCQVLPPLTEEEYAYRRFVIHETVKPWTQAEFATWRGSAKAALTEAS